MGVYFQLLDGQDVKSGYYQRSEHMASRADCDTGKILKWKGDGLIRRAFVYFPNPGGRHTWGCGSCKWARSFEAASKISQRNFASVQQSIEQEFDKHECSRFRKLPPLRH